MKVLVVDDSVVFRTQISSVLRSVEGIEVVGTASNGRIALQKLEQISVDLVILDLEMPELNGIDMLKAMREKGLKTKVIVFSSQTIRGAEQGLDALRAGADDVVLKPSGDDLNFEKARENIYLSLVPKVRQFFSSPSFNYITPKVDHSNDQIKRKSLTTLRPRAIVIAASTGGPTAIETIFNQFESKFKVPVFIVQHMSAVFTKIFAKRLSTISGMDVREAYPDEVARPGVVYIAPGDWHMRLELKGEDIVIRLDQSAKRNSVRPAADFLFESASKIFGEHLMGVVLTGMGEDGASGAKAIREKGGLVLIQDKQSSVVFGMPGAIFERNDFDLMGDLKFIKESLVKAGL